MVKKIKCPSCGPNWCQKHVFELNPLKSYLYFKKKTKLRLCPKHNKAYNTFDNVLPVLNLDKKHYTPLFTLQEQKKFYNQHDQRARFNHQKLIDRELQNESQWSIYQPRHGTDKAYCSVCEKYYSDYLPHINSHDHKKNLQSSIFTRYIMQIQQNLKKNKKEAIEQPYTQKQIPTVQTTQTRIGPQSINQNGSSLIDLDALESLQKIISYPEDSNKLEMQLIESNNIDTTTFKEIDQIN